MVIVGFPSEAHAAIDAVDIKLWRDDIEKVSKSELLKVRATFS